MATGRQWAVASARTLSRRLRRSNRAELGTTRAQALSHRSAMLRKAVVAHWELSDILGAHFSEFADSVAAADVLGLTKRVSELKEVVADGAWARHSPPPGLSAAMDAPNGVSASRLEQFREELYYQPGVAAPVLLDVVQIYDEQFGAKVVSSCCGEAAPLVDIVLTALVGDQFEAEGGSGVFRSGQPASAPAPKSEEVDEPVCNIPSEALAAEPTLSGAGSASESPTAHGGHGAELQMSTFSGCGADSPPPSSSRSMGVAPEPPAGTIAFFLAPPYQPQARWSQIPFQIRVTNVPRASGWRSMASTRTAPSWILTRWSLLKNSWSAGEWMQSAICYPLCSSRCFAERPMSRRSGRLL